MTAKQKDALIKKAKDMAWLIGLFCATWAYAESRLEAKIDQRIDVKTVVIMEELLKVSFMMKSVTSDSVHKAAKEQAAEAVKLLKQGKAR